MMTEWFLRILVASSFVGVAAVAADHALRAFGGPRRAVWAGALAASISLSSVTVLWPGAIPAVGLLDWIAATEISSSPGTWVEDAGLPLAIPSAEFGSMPDAITTDRSPLLTTIVTVLDGALPAAWLLGSLGVLGAFLSTLLRTSRARRGWRATEFDGVPVLVSESCGPAVVGVLKPAIVLPDSIAHGPAGDRRLVVAHEQQHVLAGDSRLLAAAALALATMPLNPVLWWMRHRLHEAVETDCDARVLAGDVDLSSYAGLLLYAAGQRTPGTRSLSLAFARRRPLLERRLQMMTSVPSRRPLVIAAPLAVIALGGMLVACDLVAPEPAPPQTAGVESDLIPADRPGSAAAERNEVGTITGTVTDRQTGQPIANAQLFIENTGIGTLSGADGRYALSDVPAGAQSVTVAIAGYRTDRQAAVSVDVGGTTDIIHSISEQAFDGGTLRIRSETADLQAPATPQSLQPPPVERASGGPSFTPHILAPSLTNWAEIAAVIRAAPVPGGDLVMWVYVDDQGRVGNSRVVQRSGVEGLDELAEATLRGLAEFTPAMNRDQPVASWVQLPMSFEGS